MSRREPTANDVVRVGRVSAVYPERGTVAVEFPDRERLVSKELAVGQRNTRRNADEVHLDVGEKVVCAFYGNGLAEGVVLGCIYDTKNPPKVGAADQRTLTFQDGTRIFYNRKTHELRADVVSGGKVWLSVPEGLVRTDVPNGLVETNVPDGIVRVNVPDGRIEINCEDIVTTSEGVSSSFRADGHREIYAKKLSATRAGEEVQVGTPDPRRGIPKTPKVTIQSQGTTNVQSEGSVNITGPDIVLRGQVWADNIRPLSEYSGGSTP